MIYMMKIVLVFRWYGEDQEEAVNNMYKIASVLEKEHKVYHATKDAKFLDTLPEWKVLEHVFKEIEDADALLVYQKSNDVSEGMLIEVGYAVAKGKKIIWAKKKGVHNRYLIDGAVHTIEFNDINDLLIKLKKLKL